MGRVVSMDYGTGKGVSDLKFAIKQLKRTVGALTVTVALLGSILSVPVLPVSAADGTSGEELDVEELFSDVEEKVSEALSGIDKEKAEDIFAFLKEKVSDGSLKSEEGIKAAIAQGEEKFGVSIDEATARQVVDVMEKLEDMGFSGEEIVNKAKALYDTYGAEFLSHANEAFAEVVEEAVENAITSFFSNLWEDIKTSVGNLFQSWF